MARPTTQLAGNEKLQGQQLHPAPPIGVPGGGMVSLKSLLQGPIKGQERRTKELANCIMKDKDRKLEEEMAGSRPHCAFLGSLLWERTLPYNEIEYVDLDEFLLENGLPPSPPHQPFSPANLTPPPSNQSVVDLSRPASCASSTSACSSPVQSMIGSEYEHSSSQAGTSFL